MHRIDTPTAQKDKFGAGKNGFTRGNPQTGTPATDLDDDYFDMLQEELVSVVEFAGITLDKSKRNQLLTALRQSFSQNNMVVFTTPGVTNWTVPNELKNGRKAKVTIIGSGGSGGRSSAGGGGGAGGMAVKLVDLTGINSVAITVGAGGPRPARNSTVIDGNSGNSSSFGTFFSATGGYSGGSASGGRAGVGVGGDVNSSLGPGSPGASNGSSYVGGTGGGPGGAGALSTTTPEGSDALGPGGGGSGAAYGATAQFCSPGAGKDGIVIVEW
ncbi:hypothetical protein K6W81_21970 [Enterobacter sp. MW07]|nr:hypothetical protein [Enterobacter sp. MW07]